MFIYDTRACEWEREREHRPSCPWQFMGPLSQIFWISSLRRSTCGRWLGERLKVKLSLGDGAQRVSSRLGSPFQTFLFDQILHITSCWSNYYVFFYIRKCLVACCSSPMQYNAVLKHRYHFSCTCTSAGQHFRHYHICTESNSQFQVPVFKQ